MTRWGALVAVASRGRSEVAPCGGYPGCRRSGMDDLHPRRVGHDLHFLAIGISLRLFAVAERGLAERVPDRKDYGAYKHKREATKLAWVTEFLAANHHAAMLSEFMGRCTLLLFGCRRNVRSS
jgi:hypothetical protein